MRFDIITIFPKIFDSYFGESMIKRAQEAGLVEIATHDLRDWTNDKHRTVDDTPYGGGAGMVMKVDVLYRAIAQVKSGKSIKSGSKKEKIILLSAKGKPWTQQLAKKYAKLDRLILICGRYEGVDERITNFIDEEISIGDYVLTGGELGAMVIVDSITRLLPGVLGNEASAVDESHSREGILEYPQYTRPAVFQADGQEYKVPEVLLNGNHQEIEDWRNKQMKHKR
jgi:tRNA (guanine37-N1)-methyltransferase